MEFQWFLICFFLRFILVTRGDMIIEIEQVVQQQSGCCDTENEEDTTVPPPVGACEIPDNRGTYVMDGETWQKDSCNTYTCGSGSLQQLTLEYPETYEIVSNLCFYAVPDMNVTHQEARDACTAAGGQLTELHFGGPQIDDIAEFNQFVEDHFSTGVWTDIIETEGSWHVTSDGSSVNTGDAIFHQDSDFEDSSRNCAIFENGSMLVVECQTPYAIACEKEQ